MASIEIDFEVFKALTARRTTESVTYNDVLRGLLGLEKATQAPKPEPASRVGQGDWVTKGVRFPAGTEFRATHKGQTFAGKVEDGALVIHGQRFDTPSSAAMSITKNSVNGWIFWECRFPDRSNWQLIASLRN